MGSPGIRAFGQVVYHLQLLYTQEALTVCEPSQTNKYILVFLQLHVHMFTVKALTLYVLSMDHFALRPHVRGCGGEAEITNLRSPLT
jgi:hypothetical protein